MERGTIQKYATRKEAFSQSFCAFDSGRSRDESSFPPCAEVISKMGGKWGMSFGEHFKFSISVVHCKVFWRVSNYLFNIGSFLISSVAGEAARIFLWKHCKLD